MDRGLRKQGGQEEIAERRAHGVERAAGGVEVDGVAAGVENAVFGGDGGLVLGCVGGSDGAWCPVSFDGLKHGGVGLAQGRPIDLGGVGKITTGNDFCVGLQIIGEQIGRILFEITGDHAAPGEEIGHPQFAAPQSPPDRANRPIQKR